MPKFLRFLAVCLIWLAIAARPGSGLAAEIAVVLSKRGETQTAYLDALRGRLASAAALRLIDAGTAGGPLEKSMLERADALIAVGAEAADALAAQTSSPILAVLISQANLAALQARHPKARLGGIVLDQPMARHFRLIRAALPECSRVGMLLGPQSSAQRGVLAEAATREGLKPSFAQIEDTTELLPALERLLDANDVILAVPDTTVFTATTARPILLTTYRHRKPMFGYSQAYVTAGALAAVFSSPEDVADQTAAWLLESGGRSGPPAAATPRGFSVSVNRHVARALGLDIQSDAALELEIDKRGQR